MRWKLSLTERFWAKVDKSGECWLWTGPKDRHGYGFIYDSSAHRRGNGSDHAHRVSYRLLVGPIPPGLCVCHHCDNPPCVRPEHLFVGTMGDNMRDRDAKGRCRTGRVPGDLNPRAKLTSQQAAAIRSAYSGKRGQQTTLARQYGVSIALIRAVLAGTVWKTSA